MKAAVLEQPHGPFVVRDNVPIPKPSDGQLLIKVHAIALNPIDWKMQKHGFLINSYPAVIGCDVSGTVKSVGPHVQGYSVGDAVYAFTPLGQPGCGAFAEYCLVDIRTTAKKPDNLSFEQAATVPVGAYTAALGLFYHLGFKLPTPGQATPNNTHRILVWGASSAVGASAVQLARLSGYTVIGVCSSHNFDYVKSLGADQVVDYHAPNALEEIKSRGDIQYAFDVIGDASANLCAQLLSPEGCMVSCAAAQDFKPSSSVKYNHVFLGGAYLTQGKQLQQLTLYKGVVHDLLERGQFKPLPVERLDGGLSAIANGLKLLEDSRVSGVKLVVVPE